MFSSSSTGGEKDKEICCSDDILKEILFRLPLKSIFKFKCVSKRWHHLISDPRFRTWYVQSQGSNSSSSKSNNGPLLGFFQTPTMSVSSVMTGARPMWTFLATLPKVATSSCSPPLDDKFVELVEKRGVDTIINLESSQGTLDGLGYFICSSNGLFLISSRPPMTTYFIYNPFSRESYQLPPPPLKQKQQQQSFRRPFMGLVVTTDYEEDDVCSLNVASSSIRHRYKVVCATAATGSIGSNIEIEIFSSSDETGEWQQSTVAVTDEIYIHFLKPMNLKPNVIIKRNYLLDEL
ncbi:F-box/kelch-repeat protein At3g06240-like [Telopea speciosissima]|uniref:F-box/kelch-repeat protein At3g06240-like n=1 Tax=Telopea speciosissima TaxID=54955 RepID=UPI001CC54042|nr:F-box/kelch-repeat protein At3g06240-like [Telopea speciosissima]